MNSSDAQNGESDGVIFHLDYLSMTVFQTFKEFNESYWVKFFQSAYGELVNTGRHTAFFNTMWTALAGVTVLSEPISPSEHGEYITLTIKGEGCKCITFELLAKFVGLLIDEMVLFRVTRVDLTWDNLNFSPRDMGLFMEENLWNPKSFRSLAKRGSLALRRDPAKVNEKGGLGTSSVEFGERSASRMLRCYDMHGFTRLELEIKGERAHAVILEVLSQEDQYRYETAQAHLLDFLDLDWEPWREFIGTNERAKMVLSKAREVTARRLKKWLGKQVAPALSVMQDIEPGFTPKLLAHGRGRNRERYNALLSCDDLSEWAGKERREIDGR